MSNYYFIQKAIKHRGRLHQQLGISRRRKIPTTFLNKIIHAHAGQTITNPTKIGRRKVRVTRLLERRAILAQTLRGLRR